MVEIQYNIQQEFRSKQEKYVYYIIAVSVSCIGFSVYKTENTSLSLIQIPLALSVLFWMLSVFFGLTFMKYVISGLYDNNSYIDIMNGKNPKTINLPNIEKISTESYIKHLEKNNKIMSKYFRYQGISFYLGIILFLIWHIIEMYLK